MEGGIGNNQVYMDPKWRRCIHCSKEMNPAWNHHHQQQQQLQGIFNYMNLASIYDEYEAEIPHGTACYRYKYKDFLSMKPDKPLKVRFQEEAWLHKGTEWVPVTRSLHAFFENGDATWAEVVVTYEEDMSRIAKIMVKSVHPDKIEQYL